VHERLAVFDPERKTYAPGPGLADLATGVPERSETIRLVRAHLREFAAAHDCTAILWHRSDDEHAVLIDAVEAHAAVRIRMDIGQRLPLLAGAMGRCFAAHEGYDCADLKARFERLRWQSPPSFKRYLQDIEDVRQKGYSVDEGDFAQGVTILAGPILGPGGKAVMAISALVFTAQMKGDELQQIALDLRDRTRTLSNILGGVSEEAS
jgi:DNA-binding IclR family transcriptional regulator